MPGKEGIVSISPVATTESAETAAVTARSRDRRRDLIAAADRVIRRYGDRASAALIAKEAGVTKPIIYRHFADIDDLYRELAEHYLSALREITRAAWPTEGDRATRYRAVVDAYLAGVEAEPNVYRFFALKGRIGADGREADAYGAPTFFTHQWAASMVDYFVRSGPSDNTRRQTVMAFGLIGALRGVVDWWLHEGCPDRPAVVDALTELLLRGVAHPAADALDATPVG
jgi:AcrR family transcriptional regulator